MAYNLNSVSSKKAAEVAPWDVKTILREDAKLKPDLITPHGTLYQGDCNVILAQIADDSVDMIFADPPFNLAKDYGGEFKDMMPDEHYLAWSKKWVDGCIRVLKPGGAFLLYNLPKWNIPLGAYMGEHGMTFRHWIAINIKFGLPIKGRLYPAHYSLLYYVKGEKPKTFHQLRTPIEVCRHCGKEIKDYGGHRNKMNPNGVNLTDVWSDIFPVRHWKFKSKKRGANQLSTKLLWRAIQLTTDPGDVVLDPFGGSGTTYDVAEHMDRCWVGIELEKHHCEVIRERLTLKDLYHHPITDYVE